MVSAQDEQRPIKERLEDKGVIYNGTPMKILKQIPPNRGSLLISFLERHSSATRSPKKSSARPIKTPLDINSRSRIKSYRLIRIQKRLRKHRVGPTQKEA
ncbi:hypothetical protein QL285_049841 [Trifolium repens]|nr:hypothetical protein QL285_049841 [Trifolium repens]